MAVGTSALLCLSLFSAPSLAALPWMCDCEADPEHSAGSCQVKQELCVLMMDLAQEVGFDPELPVGSPGSPLRLDPKACHIIGDYCQFITGVRCIDDKVYAIWWDSLDLKGSFPKTLSKLPSLASLRLQRNQLQGSIPKLDLPNLQELFVAKNKLSGGFPEMHLPSLWSMDLSENQLTGAVPHGIGESIPQLRRLWLDYNQFEGRIPFDIPFFNNSNENDTHWGSIMCGFSGNAWSCPIQDYVKAGLSYNCEYDNPIDCVPVDLVV